MGIFPSSIFREGDIMRKNESIKKIMSTDLFVVNTTQTFSEVRKLFINQSLHHALVVDGESLIGIISHTDVLKASVSEVFSQDDKAVDVALDHAVSVKDLMTPDPITVTAEDNVRAAAEVLAEGVFHAVPVVDGSTPVGIVTSTDLIRYLIAQY
jgi:CBS domain-containing protein